MTPEEAFKNIQELNNLNTKVTFDCDIEYQMPDEEPYIHDRFKVGDAIGYDLDDVTHFNFFKIYPAATFNMLFTFYLLNHWIEIAWPIFKTKQAIRSAGISFTLYFNGLNLQICWDDPKYRDNWYELSISCNIHGYLSGWAAISDIKNLAFNVHFEGEHYERQICTTRQATLGKLTPSFLDDFYTSIRKN